MDRNNFLHMVGLAVSFGCTIRALVNTSDDYLFLDTILANKLALELGTFAPVLATVKLAWLLLTI